MENVVIEIASCDAAHQKFVRFRERGKIGVADFIRHFSLGELAQLAVTLAELCNEAETATGQELAAKSN